MKCLPVKIQPNNRQQSNEQSSRPVMHINVQLRNSHYTLIIDKESWLHAKESVEVQTDIGDFTIVKSRRSRKNNNIVDSQEYPCPPEKSSNKANLVKMPQNQENASNMDNNIKSEFILVSSRKKKICEN